MDFEDAVAAFPAEHINNILREVSISASHNACLTGVVGSLWQVMGLWS